MQVIASALAARPAVSAPADGDWAPFMARLDNALQSRARVPQPGGVHAASRRRPVVQYLAMAALLSLVTSSVGYLAYQRYAGRTASGPSRRHR